MWYYQGSLNMGLRFSQGIITKGLWALVVSAATVSTAQADMVFITSEDGYISQTGYTDAKECADKYYEQCITVHPDCGGARIYVGVNVSKILLYWNRQGKNYNIGPSKNGAPYCRTRGM